MAYGTEIQAKLGVDTSSVGTDLAGAKNTFNKWGQEVASSGGGHGSAFGSKLVGGIEHKLLGAGHLSGALAAALGLNIEKIADSIAATITRGTKEGWEEALKIEEEIAKIRQDRLEKSLSPKRLVGELNKQLADTIKQLGDIHGEQVYVGRDLKTGGRSFKEGDLNAEQLKEQARLLKEQEIITGKIADAKADENKKLEEYNVAKKKANTQDLSDGNKILELDKQIKDVFDETLKGDLTAGELAKKKIQLLELEHERKATLNHITEDGIKMIKADAEAKEKADREEIARKEKIFSLEKARFSESKKLAEDQAKISDRSKLTVGELANLGNNKSGFSLGKSALDLSFTSNGGDNLTADQQEARKKARKIQELEDLAEQKRLAGDVAGSEEAFNQVGTLRQGLVDSGATKSTEGDKFSDLQKQIAEDNKELQKTLKDLITVEKGKFVSQ